MLGSSLRVVSGRALVGRLLVRSCFDGANEARLRLILRCILLPTVSGDNLRRNATPPHAAIFWSAVILAFAAVLSAVCYMMQQSHYRQPPSWSPEDRRSFRDWSQDVLAWSILTDLDEPRQAAALRLSLRGSAQTFVRQLPAQALLQGGQIAGAQVTPMTFLMHHLAARFAPLG